MAIRKSESQKGFLRFPSCFYSTYTSTILLRKCYVLRNELINHNVRVFLAVIAERCALLEVVALT